MKLGPPDPGPGTETKTRELQFVNDVTTQVTQGPGDRCCEVTLHGLFQEVVSAPSSQTQLRTRSRRRPVVAQPQTPVYTWSSSSRCTRRVHVLRRRHVTTSAQIHNTRSSLFYHHHSRCTRVRGCHSHVTSGVYMRVTVSPFLSNVHSRTVISPLPPESVHT